VVLPETSCAAAILCAERTRARAAGHGFHFDGEPFSLTVSLVVASKRGNEVRSAEELIHQADKALYRAKAEGRDRVCVWADGEPVVATSPQEIS
jgi:diguanylate cyclase (GGDEF)-like protein